MVELVTGHAGMNHVDASDIRALLKGLVGNVNVLLPNSDDPNMTPSLNMKLPALNFLWLQGNGMGHCRLDGTDTVQIAGTSQGMYRKDYICIKYTLNQSNSTESLSIDVIQGTPASTRDAAKVPTYTNTATEKWLHLYEVVVYQNTVQTVTFMWETFKSISDSTSLSNIRSSLGFNSNGVLSEANGGRLTYRTLGGIKSGVLSNNVFQNGLNSYTSIGENILTIPSNTVWLVIARVRFNKSTIALDGLHTMSIKINHNNGTEYGKSTVLRDDGVTDMEITTVVSGEATLSVLGATNAKTVTGTLEAGLGIPYSVNAFAVRLF